MKKLAYLLTIAVLASFLFYAITNADDKKKNDKKPKKTLHWVTDLNEALKQAKLRNVPLLIYFGSNT